VRFTVDITGDARLAAWTGLSIIGALTVTMHSNPTFEVRVFLTLNCLLSTLCVLLLPLPPNTSSIPPHDQGQSIGSYVTLQDFQTMGIACAFREDSRLIVECQDESVLDTSSMVHSEHASMLPIAVDSAMECHQVRPV
jgi:hypothetical protein